MSSWQNHSSDERIAMIQTVGQDHNIEDNAVEKDWWVTVVLKALFNTSCGKWLLFKGGTSLSKGWNLINRFSEDIDISIGRNFFENVLNLTFAKCENNNQVNFVNYQSILPSSMRLIDTRVKIEISCLSMSEPHEYCEIHSLIFDKFPEEDDEMTASIKTVTPSRTFLEKALLLSEEFQKKEPRSLRMSRHLYDLDRLMDTEFAQKALNDGKLYKAIVEHRRRFYHLGYVDYDKDYPAKIDFIPQNEVMNAYRLDYESNMADGYIYGKAKSFDELMNRMEKLLIDFRRIVIS